MFLTFHVPFPVHITWDVPQLKQRCLLYYALEWTLIKTYSMAIFVILHLKHIKMTYVQKVFSGQI